MVKILSKTSINWDEVPSNSKSAKAFIEATRKLIWNCEEHYSFSFLVDIDDSFLADTVEFNCVIGLGDVRALMTISLGEILKLLKHVLQSPHHPQWDEITKLVLKDGFEYLLPGLTKKGEVYGYQSRGVAIRT